MCWQPGFKARHATAENTHFASAEAETFRVPTGDTAAGCWIKLRKVVTGCPCCCPHPPLQPPLEACPLSVHLHSLLSPEGVLFLSFPRLPVLSPLPALSCKFLCLILLILLRGLPSPAYPKYLSLFFLNILSTPTHWSCAGHLLPLDCQFLHRPWSVFRFVLPSLSALPCHLQTVSSHGENTGSASWPWTGACTECVVGIPFCRAVIAHWP